MLQHSLLWTGLHRLSHTFSQSFVDSQFQLVLQSISSGISRVWKGSVIYLLLSIPFSGLIHSKLIHGFKLMFSNKLPKAYRIGPRMSSSSFTQQGMHFWMKGIPQFIRFMGLLSFIWGAGAFLRIVLSQSYDRLWISVSSGFCLWGILLLFLAPHSLALWEGSFIFKLIRNIFTLEVSHER